MKLHIFNPEHDIALAHNDRYFTPPHAGRELRSALGFLPSLWADDGDFVLVDDVEAALERVRHIKSYAHDVVFVTKHDIPELVSGASDPAKPFDVEPWGWDRALCFNLERYGVPKSCMPDDARLDAIRMISGRIWANSLRAHLSAYRDGLIAMPLEHTSVDSFIESYEAVYKRKAVVKSPWSSSGRGVRYFDGDLRPQDIGWLSNVIKRQGSVTGELYYNKVKDFAVEFYAHSDGTVTCEGLSLFKTVNGAYTGNVIVSEDEKWRIVDSYGVADALRGTIDDIVCHLPACLEGRYCGPFGIDMMVLSGGILHPCVELNLRRTMGHVALSITPKASVPQRLMRIDYTNRYHFRIIDTFENVINNSLIP